MRQYLKPAAETLEFELEGNVMNSLSNGGGIITPMSNGMFDDYDDISYE